MFLLPKLFVKVFIFLFLFSIYSLFENLPHCKNLTFAHFNLVAYFLISLQHKCRHGESNIHNIITSTSSAPVQDTIAKYSKVYGFKVELHFIPVSSFQFADLQFCGRLFKRGSRLTPDYLAMHMVTQLCLLIQPRINHSLTNRALDRTSQTDIFSDQLKTNLKSITLDRDNHNEEGSRVTRSSL